MREADKPLDAVLVQARRLGVPCALPAQEPTLEQAYAIQRSVMAGSNMPVMVWKLALTSAPAREAFGAAEPAVGRLAASAILNSGAEARTAWAETYAEAEIVFELGSDLPPEGAPYTRESVLPAIKAIYAGIELAATRFETSDLPLGSFVADNAMGYALVLGKRLAWTWEERFADLPVTMTRNGEVQENGNSARVMGNPIDALAWLANWLCVNGEGGLRREQLVASGSCTGATEVKAGDDIRAGFGGIDAACITLVP
ncbi:2-keto-4-pentenoate hydratase [Novosphingobium cyanobacteriorum]|uniref:Fumarylacetoacetate hydrolase family protein n=1 Tax=Novosphingobium cyanobacteriorum TaxID=3024215 RepID=A0ABT6CKC8_9SPHN|nr:fumarylacetoacetate hydrolase family protein [Novosphingobium cyanobacteriorum]MDF8333723.1 fumarylacetoacetate hydrolase family protein [Novosphingobium cyanobacteriorum]